MVFPLLRRALLALTFIAIPALAVSAQPASGPPADSLLTDLPQDWAHLDFDRDGFVGMSTYRAYEELLNGRVPERRIVVAVIDSGVDVNHEGLAERVWINPEPGADGYADDRYGWNFIGGPDGRHVDYDTYEVAREVARLRDRFAAGSSAAPEDSADYAYYQDVQRRLTEQRAEMQEYLGFVGQAFMAAQFADGALGEHFGRKDFTLEEVAAIKVGDPEILQAQEIYLFLDANDLTLDRIREEGERIQRTLEYSLNPDFDPRPIVGDDYDDVTERVYGNPDVGGPDPSHGTGVASTIAGRHGNAWNALGVAADSVFIMAVRAVPNGDERDKDVANAIRYAVDRGAHIINMSFGKPISPQKEAVDEAVRYAMERGVLLVHAAGNDGRDLTTEPSFPSRRYLDGEAAPLWLEVGASTAFPEMLAASFSNYGAADVDVFAPGEDVWVLAPGNEASSTSGTSFAAPHVAGLAALLMSLDANLTAADARQLVLDSAVSFSDAEVVKPGSEDELVPFGTLSVTGGVANVYEAVRLADSRRATP